MQCIEVKNKKHEKLFLLLFKKLYGKFKTDESKKILYKKHILSSEFEIHPFIVIDNKEIISRCILFYYPNDENAYIGFFESENNKESTDLLFNTIKFFAKLDNKKSLIGPYNGSFWISYRMKVNNFNKSYVNEPNNKDYYKNLWSNFNIKDTYYSHYLKVPTQLNKDKKCELRLEQLRNKGYIFTNPNFKTFPIVLDEIYEMLIKSYSNFPGYKYISKEKFKKLYNYLRYILDYNMVHIAYKENKLVGFFICIPNYPNKKEFVMLYMAAEPGVGSALASITKNYLQENNLTSIGALIHEGKVTNYYYKDLIIDTTQYELYQMNI